MRKFFLLFSIVLSIFFVFQRHGFFGKKQAITPSLQLQLTSDQLSIITLRKDLSCLLEKIQDHRLFSNHTELTREDRLELWQLWNAFLDCIIVLDSINQTYDDVYKKANKDLKTEIFNIKYAVFLAQYRYSMDFIFELEKYKFTHKLLNEPIPELGLPKNTYSTIKFRFLNLGIASRFAEFVLVSKKYDLDTPLLSGIKEDASFIIAASKLKSPYETLKNGVVMTKDTVNDIIFPLKKRALYLGTVKVRRFNHYLITDEQQSDMVDALAPGDILLERREWHLSNLGIPGFWPHAALYIGTPLARSVYFSGDEEVEMWVKQMGEPSGDFELLLQQTYPVEYEKSCRGDQGEPFRIIESYAPGVSLTTISLSTHADSVAALRPNVSNVVKARAVFQAFHYLGRPYDYDFDFQTDSALVCTELVAKSYEGTSELPGIVFPKVKVVDKEVTPANEFARLFDIEADAHDPLFSFVFFYDGNEKINMSVRSTEDEFRKSWKRPKWYILTSGR